MGSCRCLCVGRQLLLLIKQNLVLSVCPLLFVTSLPFYRIRPFTCSYQVIWSPDRWLGACHVVELWRALTVTVCINLVFDFSFIDRCIMIVSLQCWNGLQSSWQLSAADLSLGRYDSYTMVVCVFTSWVQYERSRYLYKSYFKAPSRLHLLPSDPFLDFGEEWPNCQVVG